MSLIRDEDRCCCINRIFAIVSSLFGYHRLLVVLCVCSTVLCAFLCPLLRPHHFVFAGLVSHTRLSVHSILCNSITVECRILNKVVSQQISARRKQSTAS